jgi:ABC-type phosphate/phosphonate transport system substrate-binding protein
MPAETRNKIQKSMAGLKNTLPGLAVLDSMEMSDMQPVKDSDYDQTRAIIDYVFPKGGP